MGGQHINDHSFWAGKGGHGSVFPQGPHKVKMESSADGAGELSKYEDTTEAIKASQTMAERKMRQNSRHPYHRN